MVAGPWWHGRGHGGKGHGGMVVDSTPLHFNSISTTNTTVAWWQTPFHCKPIVLLHYSSYDYYYYNGMLAWWQGPWWQAHGGMVP